VKKTLTCTVCPRGCEITAEYTSAEDIEMTGFSCPRGKEYAMNECFDPKRVFTSSVRIDDPKRRMLPVRTRESVPKDMLLKCAAETKRIEVRTPVKVGQVIEKDFLGTGTDLVASMSLDGEVADV